MAVTDCQVFNETELADLNTALDAEVGDLLMFMADTSAVANEALGRLRGHLGQKLNLARKDDYKFAWVTDFPLLEWDAEESAMLRFIIPLQPIGRRYCTA